MAGMFYNLSEVIEKLGKNEAEIKDLVRQGKLREFRDGEKQLYKTEDVDALSELPKGDTSVLDDSLELSIDESGGISLAPEELDTLLGDTNSNPAEADSKNESKFKLDETGELMADEIGDLGDSGEEITLSPADDSVELSPAKEETVSNGDTNISLSDDSINVLANSDSEFKISDDTSGETKLMPEDAGSLDDDDGLSIARLDDDVNLDSFGGSGSGLLDLSLQADDTSLGAVLDDIYPESPTAESAQSPLPVGNGAGGQADIFDQAEPEPLSQPDMTEAAAAPVAPVAAMAMEVPADTASNIFGVMLFVPLIATIYAIIVLVSEYSFIPELKILSPLQPILWYVAGGLMGLTLLMALIAAASGGTKKPKSKTAKPKKTKKPKAKKAKKVKKGKGNADYQQ